jgi:hypothetical protein
LGGLPLRFWFLELCAIPRLLRDERWATLRFLVVADP